MDVECIHVAKYAKRNLVKMSSPHAIITVHTHGKMKSI